MRLHYYPQTLLKSCGISALKSMIHYYSFGKVKIIKEDLNHDYYSLLDLKDIASEYGFNLVGKKYDLNQKIILQDPMILLLEENKLNHFVFFYRYKNNKYYIIDPSYGKRVISQKDFCLLWTGYALCYQNHVVIKNKENIRRIDIFSLGLEVILNLPIIILMFFVTESNLVPLIFILLLGISSLLRKFITLYKMKKFDHHIEEIIKKNPSINEDLIKKLYNYKKDKFIYLPLLFTYIMFRFIYFLILVNLPNGYYLAVLFIVMLILELVQNKIYQKKYYLLSKVNKGKSLYQKYRSLNDKTNSFVLYFEIFKAIKLLVFASCFLVFYLIFKPTLQSIVSIFLLGTYICNKDELKDIIEIHKNLQIGETIFRSLNE